MRAAHSAPDVSDVSGALLCCVSMDYAKKIKLAEQK